MENQGTDTDKNISNNIPMCHQINLVGCDLDFEIDDKTYSRKIFATCKYLGKTSRKSGDVKF